MMIINQRKLMERVEELIADGYVQRGRPPGTIVLTMKGLETLMATADRPTNKSKLTKESLEVEREIARKREAQR
jgi:hypothetical protein